MAWSDAMYKITPWFCAFILGSAAFVALMAPLTLMANKRSKSASLVCSIVPDKWMPALLTKTSTGPDCDTRAWMTSLTSEATLTSHGSQVILGWLADAGFKSRLNTWYPPWANLQHIASPIPAEPPVTIHSGFLEMTAIKNATLSPAFD